MIRNFFDSKAELPSDPVLDKQRRTQGHDPRKDQRGLSPLQANYRGERGTITDVFPDTQSYSVVGDISGEIPGGVPRILQSPSDKKLLPIGTTVLITHEYGTAMIAGVLPAAGSVEDNNQNLNITGDAGSGGDPLNAGKSNANFRTPNTPRDMLPGDDLVIGPEGNAVGVLSGGISLMKSGMAQVQTHMLNDLVKIICRNFQHISDMGMTEIKNDGGKLSYSLRWGADQTQEAGADQENWTIRLDVGTTGNLFNFELTRPDGISIFKFHVSNDGKLEIFGADGIDLVSGALHTQKHLADRETVIKNDDTLTVSGNQIEAVRGSKEEAISSSFTQTVGNDRTISSVRHETKTVGGNLIEKIVGGNAAVAKPTNKAYELTINNGKWEVKIGDPASGANPIALAGFDLSTFTGDIIMKAMIKGNLSFETLLGNAALKTVAGNATLKTDIGIANVDGTTVNLGPIPASMANPLVLGSMYATALGAYTAAHTSGLTAAITATSSLLGSLSPGPVMGASLLPWFSTIMGVLNALLSATTTLTGALPGTLSTKSFTA